MAPDGEAVGVGVDLVWVWAWALVLVLALALVLVLVLVLASNSAWGRRWALSSAWVGRWGQAPVRRVRVAVGADGARLKTGVAGPVSRGGVEVAVSAPGLEDGCAPAAANVVGGDGAGELKTPNAEPIGELRRTIKTTAARRTA